MELSSDQIHTELPIIPKDWLLIDLTNLCVLQRGFDITEATRKPGDIPVYSSSGISYFHNQALVSPPGVVTGRKGILGKVFYIQEPFWPHDTTLWVKDFKGNYPAFVSLVLSSFHLERLDASTSVPTLNRNNLAGYKILIPSSIAEQKSIAKAINDIDSAIAGIDRLIAKKQDIKQAVMQQLLTGRRRLPGFNDEWKAKRIGDFTDCTSGGTPSTSIAAYWGGSIRWMSSGELNLKMVKEVEGRITDLGLRSSSAKMIPMKCVLVGLAGQGKTRGTVAINFVELCTNQSIAAIFPSPTFVPEYLYYNLDSRYTELRALSAGDGGRGGLNLSIIKSLNIPFPSQDEQSAIATVLSDIDGGITAMEQQRAKNQALKQGMMQELLTGRIRLV